MIASFLLWLGLKLEQLGFEEQGAALFHYAHRRYDQ